MKKSEMVFVAIIVVVIIAIFSCEIVQIFDSRVETQSVASDICESIEDSTDDLIDDCLDYVDLCEQIKNEYNLTDEELGNIINEAFLATY